MRRFADPYFSDVPQVLVTDWKIRIYEEDAADLSNDDFLWKHWLPSLRDAVRVVWKSSDHRFKHWGVFSILEKYFAIGDRSLSGGPVYDSMEFFFASLGPATPFELALMRLLSVPHSTRFCANPECGTPYFWAEHASQKYCSEPCATVAQREYKRKWWTEHGNQWRRLRAVEHEPRRRKSIPKPKKNTSSTHSEA
jgi:hypothetical protein